MRELTSKEVADMIGKRHDNFLRDIRKYITELGDISDTFFTRGTYKDTAGRERLGFMVTKAGCELICTKLPLSKREDFTKKVNLLGWDEDNRRVEDVMSVKEAAEYLGISERSVRRRIESGKLTAVQKPVTQMITAIPKSELEEYKESA